MNLLAGLHFLIENRVARCFHVLLKYYYTWLVIALLGGGRSPCLHVLLAGAGIWALWTWAVSVQVQQKAALKKFEPVHMCVDSPSSVWALFNAGGRAFSTRNSQCLYGHLVDEHEPRRWRSMFATPHFMNNITQDQLALFWKVRIGISCAVTCMLWKAWPVISFIGNKLASDNTKMRHRHEFCTKSGREQGCMRLHEIIPRELHRFLFEIPRWPHGRLFGPFAFGPKSDQEELMRAVVSRQGRYWPWSCWWVSNCAHA